MYYSIVDEFKRAHEGGCDYMTHRNGISIKRRRVSRYRVTRQAGYWVGVPFLLAIPAADEVMRVLLGR